MLQNVNILKIFYPKNNNPLIETHLINYNNNIYDKTIEVFFIDRIRDEKKFTSAQKLIEQMNNDVDKAYKILLLMGIGVFIKDMNKEYLDIMKELVEDLLRIYQ